MRGYRGYRRIIKNRGGYAPYISPWAGNPNIHVPNSPTFPFNGNNPGNGVVRRPTGGRTSGRSDRAYDTGRRFGRGRNPNNPSNKVGTHEVKDGPVVAWPLPHDYGVPYYPTTLPVHVNFGIKRQRVRVTAAGSTFSYSNLFAPRRIAKTKEARMLNRGVPTQSTEYFLSQRSQCGCGQQTYFAYSWLTSAAFDSMLAGSASASAPKTSDLWLRRSQLTLLMTNNTNANVFVEIWEGYYRRTCANDATIMWRQGLTDQGLTGPTGATTAPDVLYGMDPLKSKLFTQFCRVTNVTSLELGEGRSHKHVSRYYANHKYNNELLQQYGTSYKYLSGMTRFIMPIYRGSPVNEKTNVALVSTSVVCIDQIVTMKHSFFYNTPNQYSMFTSGTFPTLSTPSTMNEATGAQVDNTAV